MKPTGSGPCSAWLSSGRRQDLPFSAPSLGFSRLALARGSVAPGRARPCRPLSRPELRARAPSWARRAQLLLGRPDAT
eukprot:332098-Pyramimonas_sp.AAC.1